MRYGQLVIGPAGSGKSTYCAALQTHGVDTNRNISVINLDPAAEQFQYTPVADVRDLIKLDDVLEDEELDYGPNGGLVFCMEYLMELEGIEWLQEVLGDYNDDYILFDCPGQIELYTHMDIMQRFAKQLQEWNFNICSVFILDSHYMVDGSKFLSGSLTAMSAMITLQLPHMNILSKVDLLSKEAKKNLDMFLQPDVHELLASEHSTSHFNKKYHNLTSKLGQVVNDYSLVNFIPLDLNKEESISNILLHIDSRIQYGEDLDVRTQDFGYEDQDEEEENNLREFFEI